MNPTYDAILVVSFGGPEGHEEVMPFLENVLRGKRVPAERMLQVAEHYHHFGGVSPINSRNRALIAALEKQLITSRLELPVYWGNRNWHPLLPDTLSQMRRDGIRRALAFVTSAFSSYSGCRQYRENIAAAQQQVGAGAPQVDKLRVFFNHPGFIESVVERVQDSLKQIPAPRHRKTHLVYTAHSIPTSMAATCSYVEQLQEACQLVSNRLGDFSWQLVYQSRSGPTTQPWLEPDICDYLRQLHAQNPDQDVVVVPVGFISDHMEVLFDLDIEAKELCHELGMTMTRAKTVGTHPRFVQMICELIMERTQESQPQALGALGPSHDVCPEKCCPLVR
ncbi:MAG: ferrochelatase [Planctomycetaceae bacterium]|nr:ferrochelatase [Planctomycetaceae bacterium]MBP62350.1 ferrochelatase [Planctomycetaceae bacterium]